MDLVERYIAAIKFWLPAKTRDDIAAELAEDIRSEIEEAEAEKGRRLSENEVASLLKARGAPMVVASRYMPQRSLIGLEIMPVYLLVLKIVAAVCLAPLVIAWIAAPYVHGNPVGHLLMEPASSLLTAFAVVTIIFAIIEYKGIIPVKSQSFNPKALPPAQEPGRIKRADSVADITANLVLLWFFFAGYLSQSEYWVFDAHIVLSPAWVPFWQAMVVIQLVETALAAAQLFKPYWTVPTALLRTAIDLAEVAAFFWLFQSHVLRAITGVEITSEAAIKAVFVFDSMAQYALPVASLFATIVVARVLWRLYRLTRQHRHVKAIA